MRLRNTGLLGVFAFAAFYSAACKKGGGDAAQCPTCVIAGEHGFAPTSLTLPKGAPGAKTTLTFTRTTDETCATEVVFPDLNIKEKLPLNTAVKVEVPTDSPRTLTFQCAMGMYKGSLLVQ
jgi:plastocyanin domain-containing protein